MSATTVQLPVRGPFDLSASTLFLEGFAPSARPDAAAEPGTLRLAFPAGPSWRPAGVLVRQQGPGGAVSAEISGPATEPDTRRDTGPGTAAAAADTTRILSLDVDGSGFADVGERDPVIGALQRRYAGLRPVLFHSPYEAGCWTVIGHRIRIAQAAAIKQRIAEQIGDAVDVAGVTLASFPPPGRLLAAGRFPGLAPVKAERLEGIATAALDGVLDAGRLRSMDPDDALADLQRLAGIGPFSAGLILVRGAGHPDVFPASERRLHEEMARSYGLADPALATLAAIAGKWRPYRSWAALLLRSAGEDRTAGIGRS
jgi:3-methyladenine DNA glycosylase/8-oxoguanine DNA glycosylase